MDLGIITPHNTDNMGKLSSLRQGLRLAQLAHFSPRRGGI